MVGFARDSEVTITCPCRSNTRYTESWYLLTYSIWSRVLYRVYIRREQPYTFTMQHLRFIVKITLKDKVTNEEKLERTGLPSLEDLLIRKNLCSMPHGYSIRQDPIADSILSTCLLVTGAEEDIVYGSRIPPKWTLAYQKHQDWQFCTVKNRRKYTYNIKNKVNSYLIL